MTTESVSAYYTLKLDGGDFCTNPKTRDDAGAKFGRDFDYTLLSKEEQWQNAFLLFRSNRITEYTLHPRFEQFYKIGLESWTQYPNIDWDSYESLYLLENDDSDFSQWYKSQKTCYLGP